MLQDIYRLKYLWRNRVPLADSPVKYLLQFQLQINQPPTLTQCVTEREANSLLRAKMRRGGTARVAPTRRPTLKRMEEDENVEEREEEAEDGSDLDSDFGPLLGALLID